MIEFTSDSYIVGIWFASNPKSGDDWMSCVVAHPENKNRYKGWYRFRKRKDESIFDSEDEKTWTTFQSGSDQTEEEIISTLNEIHEHISIIYKDKDVLMVQGNLEKFMGISKTKDWLNMKVVSIEEFK